MRSKSRVLLLALAALLVVLALAAPAMAASNVTKGDSQLIVPAAKVSELQGKYTSVIAMNEIAYKPQWSKSLSWWFDMPVWTKVINQAGKSYWTNYNVGTGKGTFYHSGQLVVVNGYGQKGWKWQGIRIVATSKGNYQLVATTGNSKPYNANQIVAGSTAATKITHSGKKYHIAGIKFYLTLQEQAKIAAATGTSILTTTPLFNCEIFFTMK
jgi:hypothetical protein